MRLQYIVLSLLVHAIDCNVYNFSRRVYNPVAPFRQRAELGAICERENFIRGAELGVLHGTFSKETLESWPSCQKYVLVDLWAPQKNYQDLANADMNVQNDRMRSAVANTQAFQHKIEICRNFTTVCATRYTDSYFDYVYVDARHDYQGVSEDLNAWWPKVKRNGMLCGHDFVYQGEGPAQSGQRWDINGDGSIDVLGRAVRGAVENFARQQNRQIQVGYAEPDWPSYCIRK